MAKKQINLVLTEAEVEQLDQVRKNMPGMPTRAAAVREMVQRALRRAAR